MKTHLNPLKVKIVGFLPLETDSPLHIGSGGEEAIKSFLRLPGGELVIPSSTWKGAFRHVSEKLARGANYAGEAGLAVKLYRETGGGIRYRGDGEEFERFVEKFSSRLRVDENLVKVVRELGYTVEEIKSVTENSDKRLLYEMAESYLALQCPIGKLYGNKVMAGKVRFGDVIIEKSDTNFRTGIGIERGSMRVDERRRILYSIELIKPRTRIKLPIIIDNLLPGESDSILFASTLEYMLEFGLSIGGRKTVGLGELNIATGEEDATKSLYLIKLDEDKELAIGNPFKRARKISIKELIEYLRAMI